MINIDELNSRIRKRIAESRRKNSLTQYELSLKIGHNDKYISLIESGVANPSLSALIEIANALGEPLEYFISDGKSDEIGERIQRLSDDDRKMILSLLEHFEKNRNN